ncbi:MAG: hypothetical protein JSU63_20330, partial [Phycisphaerales bacterium]
ARQFLSRLQPPKVDHVHGLSPAISIEQKTSSKSPRSTVGTVTEIYDYMRILWSRIGQPYCPKCKVPIGTQSSDEIVEKVLGLGEGRKVILLAPIEPTGQESYDHMFKREKANGYARVRVDGVIHSLDEPINIDRRRRHQVELVVDRIVIRRSQASRISDSIEQALSVGDGVMIAQIIEKAARDANVDAPFRTATVRERTYSRRTDGPLPHGRGSEKTGPDEHQDVEKSKRGSAIPSRDRKGAEAFAPDDSPAARGNNYRFSQHHSCDTCGQSYEELSPHNFSFNSRLGWCDACEGLGIQQGASPTAIVIHPTRSITDGAIAGWGELGPGAKLFAIASALADHIGFDPSMPWNGLTETQQLAFLHGCGDDWIEVKGTARKKSGTNRNGLAGVRFKWHGFFPAINRATRSSWQYRKRLEELVTDVPCEACTGGRLRIDAAAVRVSDATLHEVCLWPLGKTLKWFDNLTLSSRQRKIAGELLKEVVSRLRFLVDVGVDYLSLHRTASTLSGGESQRIQLASQIGTGLTGVLYVLDEPTIGLHPRDNNRLIRALKRLRDLGNTLMLVEHDREVIDSADHVLDFGPGAGAFGGEITAAASPKRLRTRRASLTGRYLSNKQSIPVPSNRRTMPSASPRTDLQVDDDLDGVVEGRQRESQSNDINWLIIHGARENNLKEIDVALPLGRFTCVTGVSGSGKSSLVSEVLYKALAVRIHRARLVAGGHQRITGIEHVDKVINADQSPIGNSPTSNPATYTGVFDAVRELFAKLPLSKIRGYSMNRFSFNRPGGRCEACLGMGQRCIEMHFLPDVWIECENCKGQRYVEETLDVQYRDKSIADVLDMRVSEALELFESIPKVRRMLQTLDDVGLGYLQLGQSAPTLSAGEAQRVKLAAELGRPSTGKTLYILDEPTTGLHFDDLKKLLAVLQRLVDLGNTCICIEHNLDVIKTADWVIDLGPQAGDEGGIIVAEGTPERIAGSRQSQTGKALKPVLKAGTMEERLVHDPRRQQRLEKDLAKPVDVGAGVEMPWERNGRAWHTVNHLDHKGAPVEWDPELLLWLIKMMESLGQFAPTDWNHASRIELKAPGNKPWCCHILTGNKDLLHVALRVGLGKFTASDLRRKLGIKDLDDRPDLPIYGQWSRVRVRPMPNGWQDIRLFLRDFKDVNKTTYRTFLKAAANAYFDQLDVVEADPDSSRPWKKLGQQWHLSQKSIHPRHVVRWRPALLMAMVGRLKSIQPDLSFSWNSKTAGLFAVPGEKHAAGKIVTNIGRALRIELRAPSGSLTPTQVDRLGEDCEIKPATGCDRVTFWIHSLGQCDTKQLADAWRRCRESSTEESLQPA